MCVHCGDVNKVEIKSWDQDQDQTKAKAIARLQDQDQDQNRIERCWTTPKRVHVV